MSLEDKKQHSRHFLKMSGLKRIEMVHMALKQISSGTLVQEVELLVKQLQTEVTKSKNIFHNR